MKYEFRDTPGLVPIALYGVQHYISTVGSLVLIPLVTVPAMGGTHEDTSMVVSTVLFMSGVTTLLHAFFGSRLPLIQGPSFVYLAPALVGSYHSASLSVASRPPTPGVLSRGIGLEGVSSILAGLWGTGTASTTLTENVHTIAVTKMGSRRIVELGAVVLIILSIVGKVGGLIASIPDVRVAALLCFMWAMLAALGLSNLRYSEARSSRNVVIVGLSLFLSLSKPAYFQQYGVVPNANSLVPSYFQPYIIASHGPFRSKNDGVNYVLNTLISFQMITAFPVAVILDNTVPGSRQEQGVYVWSPAEIVRREPAVAKDYELPFRVGQVFRWVGL